MEGEWDRHQKSGERRIKEGWFLTLNPDPGGLDLMAGDLTPNVGICFRPYLPGVRVHSPVLDGQKKEA